MTNIQASTYSFPSLQELALFSWTAAQLFSDNYQSPEWGVLFLVFNGYGKLLKLNSWGKDLRKRKNGRLLKTQTEVSEKFVPIKTRLWNKISLIIGPEWSCSLWKFLIFHNVRLWHLLCINARNQWPQIESNGCVCCENQGERIHYPPPYSLPWTLEIHDFHREDFCWKGDKNMKKQIHNAKHSGLSLLCKSL